MRTRLADRLQWFALVGVMLAHEILVGLIGRSLLRGLGMVQRKLLRSRPASS
jgi:hypothetical protein